MRPSGLHHRFRMASPFISSYVYAERIAAVWLTWPEVEGQSRKRGFFFSIGHPGLAQRDVSVGRELLQEVFMLRDGRVRDSPTRLNLSAQKM